MEDKTFELIEKMYGEMQEGFKEVNGEMQEGFKEVNGEMQEGFKEVNTRIEKLENRVMISEQEQGKKLDVLFDGYKQNADKLDRIEKKYLNMRK